MSRLVLDRVDSADLLRKHARFVAIADAPSAEPSLVRTLARDNPGERVLGAIQKVVSLVRDWMCPVIDSGLSMEPVSDTTFSDGKVVARENPHCCMSVLVL